MSDEAPPEGMETKDVHTMSGGTFQGTEAGTPGYHPAAVPNRNQTTINGDETVHEQGLRAAPEGDEKADSGSTKSTAAKSGTSRSSSSSKSGS